MREDRNDDAKMWECDRIKKETECKKWVPTHLRIMIWFVCMLKSITNSHPCNMFVKQFRLKINRFWWYNEESIQCVRCICVRCDVSVCVCGCVFMVLFDTHHSPTKYGEWGSDTESNDRRTIEWTTPRQTLATTTHTRWIRWNGVEVVKLENDTVYLWYEMENHFFFRFVHLECQMRVKEI